MDETQSYYRSSRYDSDQESHFYTQTLITQSQFEGDEVTQKQDHVQTLQLTFLDLQNKLDAFLGLKDKITKQNLKHIRTLQATFNKFISKLRTSIQDSFPSFWNQLPQLSNEVKLTQDQMNEDLFRSNSTTIVCNKYEPVLHELQERVKEIETQHQEYQTNLKPLIKINCHQLQKLLESTLQMEAEEEEEEKFPKLGEARDSGISETQPFSQGDQSLEQAVSMPIRSYSEAQNIKLLKNFDRHSMGPPNLQAFLDQKMIEQPLHKPTAGTHLIQPCLSEQQFLIFPVKNLLKKRVDPQKKGVQKVGISHYAALIKENTLIITGGEKLTNNRFSSEIQTFRRVNKLNHKKELIRCSDLIMSRSQHSICSHFNSPKVFVTGGFVTDPDQYTTECEVYHWKSDQWEQMKPMLKPLAQHASVTLGPYVLYTFCGSRGHGISHEVKFVNIISRQALNQERYSVSNQEWTQVKFDNFYDSIPAIGHLTAVELILGKKIMLFGSGFVKNKGNKTGVILAENKSNQLEVTNALVDASKRVPILNGTERPILVNWNKDQKSGVIWSFSMPPQMSEFTIMKFQFDSDKESGCWSEVGRKEIKIK